MQRLIGRTRKPWQTIVICLLLLLAPVLVLWLDGLWVDAIQQGYWRPVLLPMVVIAYIVIIASPMQRSEISMLGVLSSLIELDPAELDALIARAGQAKPTSEYLAFVLGAVGGLWLNWSWVMEAQTFWLRLYLLISLAAMFSLLGWVIYNAIISARVVGELHRQPMRIDIFDIRPFEPMGRHSLILALAFLGGIIISMLLGLDIEHIFNWKTWQIYAPLSLVAAAVFFLNMRHTQRVLSTEKKRQLAVVEELLVDATREIQARLASRENPGCLSADLAAEYNALTAYEARLRAARTWPYNTGMLRVLFFSILLPLVVRGVSVLMFER